MTNNTPTKVERVEAICDTIYIQLPPDGDFGAGELAEIVRPLLTTLIEEGEKEKRELVNEVLKACRSDYDEDVLQDILNRHSISLEEESK